MRQPWRPSQTLCEKRSGEKTAGPGPDVRMDGRLSRSRRWCGATTERVQTVLFAPRRASRGAIALYASTRDARVREEGTERPRQDAAGCGAVIAARVRAVTGGAMSCRPIGPRRSRAALTREHFDG